MKVPHKDYISAILLLALSAGIWGYSAQFPELDNGYPGPALFPRVIAACLAIGAILLATLQLRSSAPTQEESSSPTANSWLFGLLGLLLVIIFPPIREFLGFVPALIITCLGVALLLKVRLPYAIGTSILTAGFTYGIFHYLLGVPL